MKKRLLDKLVAIANELDKKGLYLYANEIDNIVDGLEPIGDDNIDYEVEKDNLLDDYMSGEEKNILFYGVGVDGESILKRNGIKPLDVGSKSGPYLGAGAEGIVLRSIFNGKEVAVKIVASGNDADIWKKVSGIKGKLSSNAQKHLPVIYDIKKDDETGFDLIVMELLVPTNSHVSEKLFPGTMSKKEGAIGFIMQDDEKLYEMLSKVTYDFYDMSVVEKDTLVKTMLLNTHYDSGATEHEVIENFIELFEEAIVEAIAAGSNKDASDIDIDDLAGVLDPYVSNLEGYLYELSGCSSFPENDFSNEKNVNLTAWNSVPESDSLLNLLQELSAMGISWRDINKDNIMERQGTGELVIMDVGSFI